MYDFLMKQQVMDTIPFLVKQDISGRDYKPKRGGIIGAFLLGLFFDMPLH